MSGLLTCRQDHLEWFAHSAYNAGLAASARQDYMSAAVLMGAAGTFYSALPMADARSLMSRQVCTAQIGLAYECQRMHRDFE